jgi:hypothetical protein
LRFDVKGDRGTERREVRGQRLACATCGRLLGTDREDEPKGDAGRPICGECNRARNFDLTRFGEEER